MLSSLYVREESEEGVGRLREAGTGRMLAHLGSKGKPWWLEPKKLEERKVLVVR